MATEPFNIRNILDDPHPGKRHAYFIDTPNGAALELHDLTLDNNDFVIADVVVVRFAGDTSRDIAWTLAVQAARGRGIGIVEWIRAEDDPQGGGRAADYRPA
jgi:hypothetical protein